MLVIHLFRHESFLYKQTGSDCSREVLVAAPFVNMRMFLFNMEICKYDEKHTHTAFFGKIPGRFVGGLKNFPL